MSDNLPQAALVEIFSRLPVESLLRFRCVCKAWDSLICSPDFITTHFNRTSPSKTHELLRHFSIDHGKERYSLRSADGEEFNELRQLQFPFKTRSGNYFRVIGSCNGLICLSDDLFGYTYTIILWNPAIRRCVTLPMPKVCFEDYGPYMFTLGFGVDPLTNDHKVVRIAYLQSDKECRELEENGGYLVPPKVEVYALSTGKWKSVKALNVHHKMVEYFCSNAFVNGAVHWLAHSKNNNGPFCNVILRFDLGSEVFGEMMLPEELVHKCPMILSVRGYENTISVIDYASDETFDVWIMKKYGVSESWNKEFSVQWRGSISSVVGFRKNGELLVEKWNRKLVTYQPGKKPKALGIRGGIASFHFDTYAESLILLDIANPVLKKQVKPYHEVDSGNERVLSKKEREALDVELEGNLNRHYFFACAFLRIL